MQVSIKYSDLVLIPFQAAVAIHVFPRMIKHIPEKIVGLVHKCFNLLEQVKESVIGATYVSSYLKKDAWSKVVRQISEIDRKIINQMNEYPGIIRNLGKCVSDSSFLGEVCYDYVARRIGITTLLDPKNLLNEGYEVVQNPKPDDVIFYFDSEGNHFNHIGIVSKVGNGEVWVQSKWGALNCYEHLEEVVPHLYGDAVVYLRESQETK